MSHARHLSGHEAIKDLHDALVLESPGLVTLFTEASCHVADAVEPKLEALLHQRFPLLRHTVVSRTDSPELLAELGVVAFPTVITWFDGKESARFVRAFSLDAVAEALERPYGILFAD
jgi:hypothetical protein